MSDSFLSQEEVDALLEGVTGEQVAASGLLKLRNDAEVTINNKVQPSADAAPQAANR